MHEVTTLPVAGPAQEDSPEQEEFRLESRAWIEANCPDTLLGSSYVFHGGGQESGRADARLWFERCFARGWTVPSWPTEFGGAGLPAALAQIVRDEMDAAGAPLPLNGQGITVIGPTILEIGTPEQRAKHLPQIANGKSRWCQGFSEPNAGSDLAAVATTARFQDSHYVVNGSKLWTTHGNLADWMFCLVRTNPDASKRQGLSLLLFPMDSAGVSTRPVELISGNSVFTECFFDNVEVPAEGLLGGLDKGWNVARRILEHERSSESRPGGIIGSGPGSGAGGDGRTLSMLAKPYVATVDGRFADEHVRITIAEQEIEQRSLALLQALADKTNQLNGQIASSEQTSIFKYLSTELTSRRMEIYLDVMGQQGLGWEGESFADEELKATRYWLYSKAFTIAGGCSEVQLDIIANRILGLPR